jgi:hypothetical protein
VERLGGLARRTQRAREIRRRSVSDSDRAETRKAARDQRRAPRAHVIEQPHLTPLVRASARSLGRARDRIVSRAMIGEGAFDRLKGSGKSAESSKQAETALAGLATILSI